MNNTTNLAMAAIFIAAILVVGTFAATTTITTQTTFAYSQKKKGGQDKGGNGNTNTPQEINAESNAVGFDATTESELQNQICTHPNNNAACSEEEVTSSAITSAAGNNTARVNVTTPKPIPEACPAGTVFDVTTLDPVGDVGRGSVLCLKNSGPNPGPITAIDRFGNVFQIDGDVTITSPVGGICPNPDNLTIHVLVDSGKPPSPFHIGDTACATF